MNNSTQNTVLKRLHFRSTHRGCKEMDLVLGSFAQDRLHKLDAEGQAAYGRLLDENDADIWDWLMGRGEPPQEYLPLLALMRECCNSL